MKDKEQQIEEIVKKTASLPSEARRAICWIAENIDLVEQMANRDKIPEREMEEYIEDARIRKDHMMLAILLYWQINVKHL